jgi:hypothetical protein
MKFKQGEATWFLWRRARVPCLTCRTIRALGPDGPRVRRDGGVHRRRLDLALGRDPSRRRDSKCCLGSASRPKLL